MHVLLMFLAGGAIHIRLILIFMVLLTHFGIPVNGGPKFLYHVEQHMSNSQRYLVVGLV